MPRIATLSLTIIASSLLFAQSHADYIEGPFDSPQEVTETCFMCHEDAATDFMKTRHWNWSGDEFEAEGRGTVALGKKNLINNFCISVPTNYPRCTSCHAGYGWKDETFDFEDPNNVDCLVCHETSGTYKKTPTGAGMPSEESDLVAAAQSVGTPTRANCGVCHFDGGGGTGVKHADMDDAILDADENLDVHMGGLGFECVDCHAADAHDIKGASHGSMMQNTGHFSCLECHDTELHSKPTINKHVAHVACETCHVPEIARGLPTKTWWDWSKAGMDLEVTHDQYGKELFAKKKGEFKWAKNIQPEYYWHNGGADYYFIGDKIDPTETVKLNTLRGDIDDPDSRIYPFKVMRGKQPYDAINNHLGTPHLFGKDGFWNTFDWAQSLTIGLEAVGLEFSGEYDFVETEMYWPVNHTVAPAENAVKCTECHGSGSRLDWIALGYAGDPMREGTREDLGLIKAGK
ncbi:MAG: tetrathionate reductase family octaheme c-type cytochrome [Ignavibacteriales bacterium]|nr:tetrathionate reductase family octaheme c-type cytochrome [Ignavibacteriales bacterium]